MMNTRHGCQNLFRGRERDARREHLLDTPNSCRTNGHLESNMKRLLLLTILLAVFAATTDRRRPLKNAPRRFGI